VYLLAPCCRMVIHHALFDAAQVLGVQHLQAPTRVTPRPALLLDVCCCVAVGPSLVWLPHGLAEAADGCLQ
jgi:hypothetical protein